MIEPSFLHQGNKKGTGLGKYSCFRRKSTDGPGVGIAVDCGGRADNPYMMRPCLRNGASGSGIDDIQNGNRGKGLYRLTGDSGHRIAGDDKKLDLLAKQKFGDLPGVVINRFYGFDPIGHPGGVSKIKDIFERQPFHQRPDDGQPADTGIKNPDRAKLWRISHHDQRPIFTQ
ncbi:MAG: hypothetical protein A4E66_01474 [Syntrophus sp. PtaB.Bin001]|nr:MAG: hypothetical protein A4E66_01474 [Syntrophus sp. PtaB.Bin001]